MLAFFRWTKQSFTNGDLKNSTMSSKSYQIFKYRYNKILLPHWHFINRSTPDFFIDVQMTVMLVYLVISQVVQNHFLVMDILE